MELTSRRDEAERELLAQHQESVAQMQRYLEDANRQLAEAVAHTAQKQSESDDLDARLRDEAKEQRHSAATTAAEILANAEARAKAIISDAVNRSDTLV